MNSTATDRAETINLLAASCIGVDPAVLRLNEQWEIAAPAELCKALDLKKDVYDDVVERYADRPSDIRLGIPKTPEELVLRALLVAGDARFTSDDPPPPDPINRELDNFAARIGPDLAAIRRVVDFGYEAYIAGWIDEHDPAERSLDVADGVQGMPITTACCRVAAIALATVMRTVEHAAEPDDRGR